MSALRLVVFTGLVCGVIGFGWFRHRVYGRELPATMQDVQIREVVRRCNLRKGPDLAQEIVGTSATYMSPPTDVYVTERDGDWRRVRRGERLNAWIHKSCLRDPLGET